MTDWEDLNIIRTPFLKYKEALVSPYRNHTYPSQIDIHMQFSVFTTTKRKSTYTSRVPVLPTFK